MTLHLTATTTEEKVVKEYLEQTVSEVLADKINNGVSVEKDGKKLISKKTLAGFMKYAIEEARKQAAKVRQVPVCTAILFSSGRSTTLRKTASSEYSTTRTGRSTKLLSLHRRSRRKRLQRQKPPLFLLPSLNLRLGKCPCLTCSTSQRRRWKKPPRRMDATRTRWHLTPTRRLQKVP